MRKDGRDINAVIELLEYRFVLLAHIAFRSV